MIKTNQKRTIQCSKQIYVPPVKQNGWSSQISSQKWEQVAQNLDNFFKNCILTSAMENLIEEFQPYKDKIPEFIIKLYHILEQKQFGEYLTWSGDSEILIKQPKRLQDKVLPHYFRHRKFPSFIRQLNMYRFTKVVKIIKERNYMYFKNPYFRRGAVKELQKITRNSKQSKRSNLEVEEFSEPQKSENLSIDHELEKNGELSLYKMFVRRRVEQIASSLKRLEGSHPQIKEQLKTSLKKCNQLLDLPNERQNISFINLQESDQQPNIHDHNSSRILSAIDFPVFFPSQSHFNF